MANPAPTINQINAFNATQGTTIDFNIIGGTELVRSNRIYIYDLSDNSLICTHLYVSTESIHELPANTDSSIVYESGKSSADFVNGAQYYAQIQTYTDTAGTQGGSGLSVAKMFWCLVDPTLTITTIPSTISTTSYNVSATYTDTSASVVSNIIQQYQFNLYSATGSLLQSSGVIVGNGEQQGTSTAYDISYNFSGLSVGSSYYVTVEVTTIQGMSVTTQSSTFTVSIDTPTLGEATVVNNACDGYISVTSNLSSEYGGSGSGEIASFETDSVNNVSSLKVNMEPIQEGSGTPSPTNVRPIRGHSGVNAYVSPTQSADDGTKYSQEFDVSLTPTSTDKVPYMFKAVGRDVYGDRESDKIVGGTVAWNQLVNHKSKTNRGITATYDSETHIYTLSGTSTGTYAELFGEVNVLAGHKYLCGGRIVSNPNSINIKVNILARMTKYVGNPPMTIGIGLINGTSNQGINGFTVDTDFTGVKLQYCCFDLTAMFGTTIADYIYNLEQSQAGAGVAWFRNYFQKDYYPYDKGTLRSVEGVSAHETVGFNQWDEEWENGSINNSGAPVAYAGNMRSKNYIKVLPNTYYFPVPRGSVVVFWYDSNYNFISMSTSTSVAVISPSNAHYMKFRTTDGYGGTYKNDICINLSNPSRNGEYEPYQKHTYPLDSSLTLRGVPKLDASNNLYYDGDTYESDGTVTRKYGIVDLGTLTYSVDSTAGYGLSNAISDIKAVSSADVKGNILCAKYPTDTQINVYNKVTNKTIALAANGTIRIYDTDMVGKDGTQFATAMSGVYLVYELATPTTETAEGFTNPQVVDNGGTEAYVTTGIVPVGHDTTYLTRDIFGGTLDLVTGVLTVDRAMVTLDGSSDESLNVTPLSGFTQVGWGGYISIGKSLGTFVCDTFAFGKNGNAYVTGLGQIWGGSVPRCFMGFPTTVTDIASARQWLSKHPTTIVYELAEPQTYQLTPHQIQTLVGQNNVWSDAGDVEVTFNLPISNLLVKRQDASDVSGDWLTLYSQPIAQASDMDFTFIDFLNQYGKTYKYALVPLLTQTQSGVEVEVEGGYTVSDEVQSIFDGVFISDSTGSQKCKANVGYGNVDMNQVVGSITPIGAKYPIVITNSQNQYHNGSISGTIVPDDYYFNGNLSRIDMVNKRSELEQFLTNKRAKIIKDWNGNIWLVMIMDNVSCTFNNNYGMGIVNFSTSWVEVGDPTNQQDLQATGLINVGGV